VARRGTTPVATAHQRRGARRFLPGQPPLGLDGQRWANLARPIPCPRRTTARGEGCDAGLPPWSLPPSGRRVDGTSEGGVRLAPRRRSPNSDPPVPTAANAQNDARGGIRVSLPDALDRGSRPPAPDALAPAGRDRRRWQAGRALRAGRAPAVWCAGLARRRRSALPRFRWAPATGRGRREGRGWATTAPG
jgi:hypothetical protein